MKKYRVYFIKESNMEWWSKRDDIIIEAKTPEEAKEIMESRSCYGYNYSVYKVEEVC